MTIFFEDESGNLMFSAYDWPHVPRLNERVDVNGRSYRVFDVIWHNESSVHVVLGRPMPDRG